MIHHLSREPRVQRLNQRCVFGDVAQLSACFESRVAYFNPSRFRASLYLRQTWHVFTVNESGIRKIAPVEGVMPLLHECVANRLLGSLEEVEVLLVERCVFLRDHPGVVGGRCGFSWASL